MSVIKQTSNSFTAIWLLLVLAIAPVSAQQQAKPQSQKNNAEAQPARQPDDANETYTLRTYEVGDLIISVQDHPYTNQLLRESPKSNNGGGAGGQGMGGGFFSVPVGQDRQTQHHSTIAKKSAPILLCQFGGGMGGGGGGMGGGAVKESAAGTSTAGASMDDLVRVLIGTVAYNSWEENGGGEGKVEPFGTALVIYQTPSVHRLISGLLDEIRNSSGRRKTMTIDARWLMLSSDDLDALLTKDSTGLPEADRKPLAEFTRRGSSIRGLINCFSSQLVFLRSGANRNVVSGWIPVVGAIETGDGAASLVAVHGKPQFRFVAETSSARPGGHVGYQPITGSSNLGALLEIRPTLIGSSNWAIVDLRSTLTAPAENSSASKSNAATDAIAPAVDRIAVDTLELATTLRMPLGKPVVVGGMTHMPSTTGAHDEGNGTERSQLYLVLEIR